MNRFSCITVVTGILLVALLILPASATAQDAESSMIERYRKSLEVDPNNPTLHYFLGIALIRENRIREGLKELRIAYPSYTDSIEMQYNMGLAFSKLNDPDSALLYLEQAEALGALDSPEVFPLINAYYNVGLAYLEQDNLPEAEKVFLRVLKLDPERVEVYRLLGDIAARSDRPDDARDYISLYLQYYPDDQSARDYLYALYFNRGLEQLSRNEPERARKSFRNALELTPDSPLVLYYLGSLDYNAGDINAAVNKLGSAYRAAPEELVESMRAMLYNSALQMTRQQKWDDALAAVLPLISGDNPRIKDLLLAGNIYLQQGDFTDARNIYLDVLEREPVNSKAVAGLAVAEDGAIDHLFNAGRSLFEKAEYAAALEKFNTVLEIQPAETRSSAFREKTLQRLQSNASNAFASARLALERDDFLSALDQAKRGLDLQPENPEGKLLRNKALDGLRKEIGELLENGYALVEQNQFEAADAHFKKVTRLDPDNREALEGLDRVEQKKRELAVKSVQVGNKALDEGRLEDGRSAYEKALKLLPGLEEASEGLSRLESLIGSMIAQEIQWGRRAKSAGQLEQASQHFRNALKLRESADIRRELAMIEKARDNKIDSLLRAARNARKDGDYSRAGSLYRRVISIDREHPARGELAAMESEVAAAITGALNEARRNMLNGEYQAALSHYRQALDLDPANKDALTGLEKGRQKLQTTIADFIESGNAALEAGKFEQAESAFEKVLGLDPYNATAKAALQRLEKIKLAGASAGDENQLYLRGIELYTKGKYAEAVSAWEQVLMLSPQHEKAKMNIEKARRKLEKIREFKGG